mmetsp:Transcript_23673/g.35532  ORF Transcript_23673/g.35532 Transcript_23673/m.35532 type:complete len:82 (+) Transcript_23673:1392-1637(+)
MVIQKYGFSLRPNSQRTDRIRDLPAKPEYPFYSAKLNELNTKAFDKKPFGEAWTSAHQRAYDAIKNMTKKQLRNAVPKANF